MFKKKKKVKSKKGYDLKEEKRIREKNDKQLRFEKEQLNIKNRAALLSLGMTQNIITGFGKDFIK